MFAGNYQVFQAPILTLGFLKNQKVDQLINSIAFGGVGVGEGNRTLVTVVKSDIKWFFNSDFKAHLGKWRGQISGSGWNASGRRDVGQTFRATPFGRG